MNSERRFYVRFRGQTLGPLTNEKIKSLISLGQVTPLHELSNDCVEWKQATHFNEFFPTSSVSRQLEDDDTGQTDVELGREVGRATKAEQYPGEWYALIEGEKKGPVNGSQLLAWRLRRRLRKNTLVWREGMEQWQPAKKVIPAIFQDQDSTEAIEEQNGNDSESSYTPRKTPPLRNVRDLTRQTEDSFSTSTSLALPANYSIASIVLGLSSIATCLGFVLGVPAIIFGLVAFSKINRGIGGGKSMAIVGITLGVISSILSIMFLIWLFLIVGWGAVQMQLDDFNH